MASSRRARAPRGVRGHAPPENFLKIGLRRCNLGTLWQEKMCNFSVSFCLYLESVVIKEIIYFTYLSPNTNTIITY